MDNKQIIGSFAVVFNDQGEVLLGQRNQPDPTHEFHQKWGFPGGVVDFGEDPKDTAIRETGEETGVKIRIVNDKPVILSEVKNTTQFILVYYMAKYQSGEIDITKDHGTSDAKWFAIASIDYATCLPNLDKVLEQFN